MPVSNLIDFYLVRHGISATYKLRLSSITLLRPNGDDSAPSRFPSVNVEKIEVQEVSNTMVVSKFKSRPKIRKEIDENWGDQPEKTKKS